MQQDALDDTYLLGLLGHLDDATIRIFTIVVSGNLSPPLVVVLLIFLLVLILIEHLNRTTTHSYCNDTNLMVGKIGNHRTAEIIGRTELANRTDNRTLGYIPVAQRTLGAVEVAGCQHLET